MGKSGSRRRPAWNTQAERKEMAARRGVKRARKRPQHRMGVAAHGLPPLEVDRPKGKGRR